MVVSSDETAGLRPQGDRLGLRRGLVPWINDFSSNSISRQRTKGVLGLGRLLFFISPTGRS